MDVDDCSPIQKDQFKNKELFRGHWLYDYIVPIYCDPVLESVMREIGYEVKQKDEYIVIFPTNHGDLNINMAKDFLNRLSKCNHTNLDDYIEYCIRIAENNI